MVIYFVVSVLLCHSVLSSDRVHFNYGSLVLYIMAVCVKLIACSGGSKGGRQGCPPFRPKFLYFHVVLGGK